MSHGYNMVLKIFIDPDPEVCQVYNIYRGINVKKSQGVAMTLKWTLNNFDKLGSRR